MGVNEKEQSVGNYSIYQYPGGKIFLDVSESPMMLRRSQGKYEKDVIKVINRILKPGMIFVDVGVNKGYFTLLGAKKVGKTGKVLAFEPEPDNCKWIKRSIKINDYNNIELFEIALGNNNKEVTLYKGAKSGWNTILKGNLPFNKEGEITVKERTLDSVLQDINCQNVDLIKIDVEGAELAVLEGGKQILRNNKNLNLIIELHSNYGIKVKSVLQYLIDSGFSLFKITQPDREIDMDSFRGSHILARK